MLNSNIFKNNSIIYNLQDKRLSLKEKYIQFKINFSINNTLYLSDINDCYNFFKIQITKCSKNSLYFKCKFLINKDIKYIYNNKTIIIFKDYEYKFKICKL